MKVLLCNYGLLATSIFLFGLPIVINGMEAQPSIYRSLLPLNPDNNLILLADTIHALEESLYASSPSPASVPPASAAINSAVPDVPLRHYGNKNANLRFSVFEDNIMVPALVIYFEAIKDQQFNTDDVEKLLRFLGAIRKKLAIESNSENAHDFGNFIEDVLLLPGFPRLVFDQVHMFLRWYKYATLVLLGKEFEYPFDILPEDILDDPKYYNSEYFARVQNGAETMCNNFIMSSSHCLYSEDELYHVLRGKPPVQQILLSRKPSYFPLINVLHGEYRRDDLTELGRLLHVACTNPSVENIVYLYYFIVIRSFFHRGQASISLWLMKALFKMDGKKLILSRKLGRLGVNLDQYALLTFTKEAFLGLFKSQTKLVASQ
jgi:hypothetical protein